MNIAEAKDRVVQAGRKLVESKLIARTWGNVSCRISESRFVITPRGRDYLSLTSSDIVEVEISDCSYSGDIKPSSEKGIHAAVYRQHPDVHFVIHTHQENASVVSAVGVNSMKVEGGSLLLGGEVLCAPYALPTTKKLARSVELTLPRSKGNAIILTHHGALCFGKNDDQAFKVASELEDACDRFVAEQYLRVSGYSEYDPEQMRRYAISRLTGSAEMVLGSSHGCFSEAERNGNGFRIHMNGSDTVNVRFDQLDSSLPEEAKIYHNIFRKHRKINYIVQANTPNIAAVSHAGITLRPYLDDFAQLVGTSVKTVEKHSAPINATLRGASAVFIRNDGALCCGGSKADATAVAMVMEKNCKAFIGALLFGEKSKPIHRLESTLMRFIYLKDYSKAILKPSPTR